MLNITTANTTKSSSASKPEINVNSIFSINDNDEEQEDDDEIQIKKGLLAKHNNNHSHLIDSTTNLLEKKKINLYLTNRLKSSKSFSSCLYFIDIILSVYFFSPIIGLYWYCTWSFLDDYFLKDHVYLSNYVSLAISYVLILPGYLAQEYWQKLYEKLKEFKYATFLRFLMRTIYIYLMSGAVVLQWRAVGNLYALYLVKLSINHQLALAFVSISFFVLTRSTRTLVCNPYLLYIDDNENFFESDSRHKLNPAYSCYWQYLFDFFLVEIIECLIMNMIWYGIEAYFDQLIYPNDTTSRILVMFVISHSTCIFLLLVQNSIFQKCSNQNSCSLVPRLIVENLFNIIMCVSTILAWKFYWDAFDYFFYKKETAFLFFTIGHVASFILAVCCNVTGSLVGPGTSFLDGECKETKAYFEIDFLAGLIKNHLGIDNNQKQEEKEEEEEETEKAEQTQTIDIERN